MRLCVPYRPDGERRDLIWVACLARWRALLPEAQIVMGDHDGDPLNRSRARNQAADGEWDVAVFADADIMVSMRLQVTVALELARSTGRLTFVHDWRAQLSEAGTNDVLAGMDPCRTDIEAWNPHTFAGCYVVPRELWEKVGGFDERFEGWGFEDLAFMRACGALGGGLERVPGVIYHCAHPRTAETHERYSANEALWRRYEKAGWHPASMRQVLAR